MFAFDHFFMLNNYHNSNPGGPLIFWFKQNLEHIVSIDILGFQLTNNVYFPSVGGSRRTAIELRQTQIQTSPWAKEE